MTVNPIDVDPFDVNFTADGSAWRSPSQVLEYPRCRWCTHQWHGLPCGGCAAFFCESSATARDDTWRPRLSQGRMDRASQIMHDTGCDGWIAIQAVRLSAYLPSSKIQTWLYGGER